MTNKYIAVKVFGNPNSNAGGMPLIVCNNPVIEIKDEVYEGMGGNSYFFTIRIEPSQVVYKIVKNRVRSYGAMREGALQIAFSIPKGYKLENGYSPYEVLVDLKDTFLRDCMNCRDSVAEAYEFKQGDVPEDALDATAKKYTLIEAGSPWHVMPSAAPKGCVVLPEDKIQEFMGDVQYAELENYSEVLVAENILAGASYLSIKLPSVPRKPDYNIIVDGGISRQKTNDIKEQVTIKPNADSRYYELTDICFSIDELLNGGSSIEGVKFDGAIETVMVSTKPYIKPREFKIHVAFTPSENEAAIYSHKGQFTIRYNGQKVFLTNDFMFTVTGEEYKMFGNLGAFTVDAPESIGYKFAKTPNFDSLKNELSWHTEKIVKKTTKNTDVAVVTRKVTATNTAAKVSDMFDLVVRVENTGKNNTFIEKACQNGKLVVKNLETGYVVSKRKLDFKASCSPKVSRNVANGGNKSASKAKSYSYETIRVPKPELGFAKYEVAISAGGVKYTTVVPNANEANNGCMELDFANFVKKNKSVKDSIAPTRLAAFFWGIVLGASLIGGACGIMSFWNKDKTDPVVQTDSTEVNSMQQSADVTNMTDDEIKKQLADIDSTLKNKKDLSFDEVNRMYADYQSNADRYKSVDNAVCQRLDDYKRVADLIQNGDYDGIDAEMAKGNGLHIYGIHRNCVALITNGFGKRTYTADDKATVKKFLKDHYSLYKKFVDLEQIKALFPKGTAPKSNTGGGKVGSNKEGNNRNQTPKTGDFDKSRVGSQSN